jgi:hypothetical protein
MWPPVVTNYYAPWPWGKVQARSAASSCINNLRAIDAAINHFALENNKKPDDLVTLQDLTPYIKLNSTGQIPSCPCGGIYSVSIIGKPPTCSYVPFTKIRVAHFYYMSEPTHSLP